MSKKGNVLHYYFKNLQKTSNGYGGFAFESTGSLLHQHEDFYEFALITNGKWQNTIDDTTTSLSPGNLLFFNLKIPHILHTETMQSEHFVFCIEKLFFEDFVVQMFPDFDITSAPSHMIRLVSPEKMHYIEYLGRLLSKNPRFAGTLGKELLFLCLSSLTSSSENNDYSFHVTDIIRKINNHLYINLSVQDICAKYPISQRTLLEQFKKATGMTIVQYKAQHKMKYACDLLANTELSLLEISSFLQYDSLSYFLNTFKKTYGITPTEYRKKHRQKSSDAQ